MSATGNRPFAKAAIALAFLGLLAFLLRHRTETSADSAKTSTPAPSNAISSRPTAPDGPVPGDALLERYADPSLPPIEDMRAIHRVMSGYFSVIKDASRHPIGGNADLSAALRGENPNREVFVRPDNPVFNDEGLLIDRWGSPVVVHPEGWRRIELRSAGPDKTPYTSDDLIISPTGLATRP